MKTNVLVPPRVFLPTNCYCFTAGLLPLGLGYWLDLVGAIGNVHLKFKVLSCVYDPNPGDKLIKPNLLDREVKRKRFN